MPPEVDESNAHVSSEIVTEFAKEFNLDEFESMETEVLNSIEKECGTIKNSFVIESTGPVEAVEEMEEDQESGLVRKFIYCQGYPKYFILYIYSLVIMSV